MRSFRCRNGSKPSPTMQIWKKSTTRNGTCFTLPAPARVITCWSRAWNRRRSFWTICGIEFGFIARGFLGAAARRSLAKQRGGWDDAPRLAYFPTNALIPKSLDCLLAQPQYAPTENCTTAAPPYQLLTWQMHLHEQIPRRAARSFIRPGDTCRRRLWPKEKIRDKSLFCNGLHLYFHSFRVLSRKGKRGANAFHRLDNSLDSLASGWHNLICPYFVTASIRECGGVYH